MPQVKHVVLLKLQSTLTPARAQEIFAALAGLVEKVPGLLDFSGGPYASPEGLQQGFTHGFVMTFQDVASRDGYLTNADHEVVKQKIIPELDGGLRGVVAFDWEVL